MAANVDMPRGAPLEHPTYLWQEAALIGAGVSLGSGALLIIPTAMGRWPVELTMAAAAAGAIPLAVRAIDRKWPAWQTLAVGGAGVMALICPQLVRVWPWWAPIMGGAVAGGLGFLAASVGLVRHHRRLWSQFMYALELRAGVDINKDGRVGKPPIRQMYVQPTGGVPALSSAPAQAEQEQGEEGYDDSADESERLELGQMVDEIWPVPGRRGRGTSWHGNWKGRMMLSGIYLSEDRWRRYMGYFERCGLVRRRDASVNAPYELVATTREQALAAMSEAIILPTNVGSPAVIVG
jgi:hypothetical protein